MEHKSTNKAKLSLLLLVFAVLFIGGCKKENSSTQNIDPVAEISIKEGRLAFTKKAFNDLMDKSHHEESIELINNVVSKLRGHQDFISLKQEEINIRRFGKLSTISLKSSMKMTVVGPQQPIPPGGDPGVPVGPPLEPVLELAELVPDPFFASVLNPIGEIEVDNTIYRVTEYGTFLAETENKAGLDAFIDSLNKGLNLSENLICEGEDFFKLRSHKIFFIDTYGYENGNSSNISSSTPSNTVIDFPVGENVFTNVDVYEFNDAKTWAGKGLQIFFGRDHFKYYNNTSRTRLKANFYSSNWGIFASVGVKSKIQIKGWTGLYRKIDDFDEMRLGWSNIVLELNLPPLDPTAPKPGNFWNGISKAIQSNISFNFKGVSKDFLVYRIDQILAFDQVTSSLPWDLRTELNNLITKLNGQEISVAKLLESGLDKQAINRLVKYVESVAVDKSKGVAFTNAPNNATIGKIIIPLNWEKKYGNEGDAEMSQTFDFVTLKAGIKNGKPIFEPAKTLKIVSGEVTALGKLNGEWAGMSVIKK